VLIDENSLPLGKVFDTPLPENPVHLLLWNPLHVCSVMMRRDWQQKVGLFDESLHAYEDWDMWLRLAWRNDAEYLDEPLLKIRFHPGNLSRNAQQVHTDNLRILAKLRRDFQAKRFHPAIRTTALRSHRALFSHYRRTRRPLSALKQLGLMAVVQFL